MPVCCVGIHVRMYVYMRTHTHTHIPRSRTLFALVIQKTFFLSIVDTRRIYEK